jgi:hypothetical protein
VSHHIKARAAAAAVLLLLAACPAGAVGATVTFASGPEWATVALQPGAAGHEGVRWLGPAHAVCLNASAPAGCPADATLYGYAGSGWPADLSAIPGAEWIWAPGVTGQTAPAQFAHFLFAHTFALHGTPVSGAVFVAADDFARLWVNGRAAGTIGSVTDGGAAAQAQGSLQQFDISALLRRGLNLVVVEAENGTDAFGGFCPSGCTYAENPAGTVFGGSITTQ